MIYLHVFFGEWRYCHYRSFCRSQGDFAWEVTKDTFDLSIEAWCKGWHGDEDCDADDADAAVMVMMMMTTIICIIMIMMPIT